MAVKETRESGRGQPFGASARRTRPWPAMARMYERRRRALTVVRGREEEPDGAPDAHASFNADSNWLAAHRHRAEDERQEAEEHAALTPKPLTGHLFRVTSPDYRDLGHCPYDRCLPAGAGHHGADLIRHDFTACREVATTAAGLGVEALRWPSATGSGESVALFWDNRQPGTHIDIVREYLLERQWLDAIAIGASLTDFVPELHRYPLYGQPKR